MSAWVRLRGVSKAFHGLPVLQNFNLHVAPGKVLALVGPSGCGKSTLLRLLAGLEAPDRGTCERHFQRVGFVFQEPRLLPWRTAWQNVALVLPAHWDAPRRRRRLEVLFEQVGLRGFEGYYPGQLSGGMRQRVALARALAVEPDLLLLDEPFSGLDFPLRLRLLRLLYALVRRDGHALTTVYVTHDVREALWLADRMVLLTERPARPSKAYDLPPLPLEARLHAPELRAIEEEILERLAFRVQEGAVSEV